MATEHRSSKEKQRMPLGQAPRGFCGRIDAITVAEGTSVLPAIELERRLIELGFTEGAFVEILHEGIIGRDPIAVRHQRAPTGRWQPCSGRHLRG
jgi:ferrous iron transport protein A